MLSKKMRAGLIISFLFTLVCAGIPTVTKAAPSEKAVEKEAPKIVSKGPKKRVGIVDFENKTTYGKGRLGSSASDILTTELFKTGAFIVVERAQLQKILGEQALGQSGVINPATAAEAGKILGLNAIVTGSISQFGVKTEGKDYGVYKQKIQKAECTVDVRVVDTTTGQVLFADSGSGVFEKKISEILGFGQRGGYDETMGQNALRAAITKFMDNLIQQLQSTEWSGRIAKVSGSTVYINAGKDVGLEIGNILMVYSLGEEIYDPQTHVLLGREEGPLKAELLVTGYVDANLTKATIKSGTGLTVNDVVKLKVQ
ncbi:MAG: CsgG/HfaB family protein [Thermodesulfobacteriota bacterium]